MQPTDAAGAVIEVSGAVHVHTDLSDGGASLADVAAAAAEAAVDFVLVADHDTMAPASEYGWRAGVFMWRGLEWSPLRGRQHFLAAGIPEAPPMGMSAPEALDWVHRNGGWCAPAHPASKAGLTGWKRDDTLAAWPFWEARFEALEVWSYLHAWAADVRPWRLFSAVRRRAEFILEPSPALLARWDRLAATRRITGIGALDNHARRFPLIGAVFPHEQVLGALTTHLLLPAGFSGAAEAPACAGAAAGRDETLLNAALMAGAAFIARDELAAARGTRLWLRAGDDILGMGAAASQHADAVVVFEVPQPAALRILRDSCCVAASRRTARLEAHAGQPGAYRAEARLDGKLWILTNHIYVAHA